LGSIRFHISDTLEKKFRERAMKRFGYGKGSLSRAVEEAINRWPATLEPESLSFEGDPVEAIEGLMSDIEIGAVDLQHKATRHWAERELKRAPS
jgi:uncharacterized protein YggL (DUF469 family)